MTSAEWRQFRAQGAQGPNLEPKVKSDFETTSIINDARLETWGDEGEAKGDESEAKGRRGGGEHEIEGWR